MSVINRFSTLVNCKGRCGRWLDSPKFQAENGDYLKGREMMEEWARQNAGWMCPECRGMNGLFRPRSPAPKPVKVKK